eukprot:9473053-Pyramimonas_sp.AAC.1
MNLANREEERAAPVANYREEERRVSFPRQPASRQPASVAHHQAAQRQSHRQSHRQSQSQSQRGWQVSASKGALDPEDDDILLGTLEGMPWNLRFGQPTRTLH